MNLQYNYYRDNNIHAVEYENNLKSSLLHNTQRTNLIQSQLGVPLSLFKNSKILEFGPNSGENSFIYFLQGAEIHFVEPNLDMHERIQRLYNNSNKINITSEFIEEFISNIKYDFVIAEGFLHAISNRLDIVKKMFTFSKSLVLITYSDKYGYFFESIKRFIYSRIVKMNKNNVDFNYEEKFALAEKLFKNDFDKLNSTRKFESWYLDIICNPVQKSSTLDTFIDYYKIANEYDFEIISMSPNWDIRNNYKWFKSISDQRLDDLYFKNINFIIGGDIDWSNDFNTITSLTNYFLDYSSSIDDFKCPIIPALTIENDIININNLLEMNEIDLVNYYLETKIFRNWGMPQHHILFQSKTV